MNREKHADEFGIACILLSGYGIEEECSLQSNHSKKKDIFSAAVVMIKKLFFELVEKYILRSLHPWSENKNSTLFGST